MKNKIILSSVTLLSAFILAACGNREQTKLQQHQQLKSLKKLRMHQRQQLLGLLLGQKKYPLQILNVSEMKNMVISISLKIGSYALLEVAKRSNIYHQTKTMR